MKRTILILLIFISITSDAFSQKLLFQKNRRRYALYGTGDIITFTLRNDHAKRSWQILGFQDSVIVFSDQAVNPKEIAGMYIDRKTKNWYFLRNKYKKVLPLVGITYFLLDVANTGEVDKGTAVFSVSMVGAGLLAKWLISEELKIKGKKRLAIIDVRPARLRDRSLNKN